MKLGRHLLETCKLCKTTAEGRARAEAEWWERRIRNGIKALKTLAALPTDREERQAAERKRQ